MGRVQDVDAVIARNVRMLRAGACYTQQDIAEKMAVQHPSWTQATVSQVERGRRAVLVSEALSLAGVFGVSLEQLTGVTHHGPIVG
jgi:transcriptional regulator with XRE-family HTH domain